MDKLIVHIVAHTDHQIQSENFMIYASIIYHYMSRNSTPTHLLLTQLLIMHTIYTAKKVREECIEMLKVLAG